MLTGGGARVQSQCHIGTIMECPVKEGSPGWSPRGPGAFSVGLPPVQRRCI